MAGVLQELRESHGYSLRAVAAAAGCSAMTVKRLEDRGLSTHGDRAIAGRVAAVFGMSLADVFPAATSMSGDPSPRPGLLPIGPWEVAA